MTGPHHHGKQLINNPQPANMPLMPVRPTILVFDSGLGGLTVLREVVAARPNADYDAQWAWEFITAERYTRMVYELVAKELNSGRT